MKIVGLVESTMYGICLIAENAPQLLPEVSDSDSNAVASIGYVYHNFSAVGGGIENTVNWVEITQEEWMGNFS